MRSAEPTKVRTGRFPPPNLKMRECSSTGPATERTRTRSDRPGIPGRMQHQLRTTTSTVAPAIDAR